MAKNFIRVLPAALLMIFAAQSSHAAGLKFRTAGTFTDRSGVQHAWSINETHTLVWDGQPYVPAGAVLAAASLVPGASEEAFSADAQALDAALSKGITDILVRSSRPITQTSPAALQRLVDYLDEHGFTYGIEINDGPAEPLAGYIVAPGRYRLEGPSADSVFAWNWPDCDAAVYAVVNRTNTDIEEIGGAVVKDGTVTISLREPLNMNQILMVCPRKRMSAAGRLVGDVWSGFGEYRDRLLDHLKQVRFGPGLRFFFEPLASKTDFAGEGANIIPDSGKFRLGFEAYLHRKYTHEGSLNAAWGLNDKVRSIEEATRLLPLWASGRGVAIAYDRFSGRRLSVDPSGTQAWADINEYRDSSMQEYLNAISTAIKKQIADVPVIVNCSRFHRIYANPYGIGGFDGLGAVGYGTDDKLVTGSAGPAYALAEESGKTTWFVCAASPLAGAYPSENAMTASLDLLREAGCKGFFVDGLRSSGCDLAGNPAQLDWLKGFKEMLGRSKPAEFVPTVVAFPSYPPTGAYVKRLGRGCWWLPTLRPGKVSFIGDGLGVYGIAADDRICLWSGSGPRTITLKAGPSGFPTVEFPDGAALSTKKDGVFVLNLTDTPVVLKGMDVSLVFPYETAQREIDSLAALIPEADKAGVSVQKARDALSRARTVMEKGQPLIAYGIAQSAIQEIVSVRGGEVWVEGESCSAHNFDSVAAFPGASGGLALSLDTADNPPMLAYTAALSIDVPINSSYELWMAATPPADASAMSYNVDDGTWQALTAEPNTLQPYAPGLAWYRIGAAGLMPGRHVLKIRADSRRSLDNRFFFALDAVVASPKPFKPDGVNKPY